MTHCPPEYMTKNEYHAFLMSRDSRLKYWYYVPCRPWTNYNLYIDECITKVENCNPEDKFKVDATKYALKQAYERLEFWNMIDEEYCSKRPPIFK